MAKMIAIDIYQYKHTHTLPLCYTPKTIGTHNNVCTPIGATQHHINIYIFKQMVSHTFESS